MSFSYHILSNNHSRQYFQRHHASTTESLGQWFRGKSSTGFWMKSWKSHTKPPVTLSFLSLGIFTGPWPKKVRLLSAVIFILNLSHELKYLRRITLRCKVNQCIYPSCQVQQQLFQWLCSKSTDRHPWLSRAWLLINLHWAAKFKVKKCWAQSHRVILCWAKQIQGVWSPRHQHDREFIRKRICSNKFKKLVFLYNQRRETSLSKG